MSEHGCGFSDGIKGRGGNILIGECHHSSYDIDDCCVQGVIVLKVKNWF